jgi:hypothetical protein
MLTNLIPLRRKSGSIPSKVTSYGLYFAVIKYSMKWNIERNEINNQHCGVVLQTKAQAIDPANTIPRRNENNATRWESLILQYSWNVRRRWNAEEGNR